MRPVRCFWTAPNGRGSIALRRYRSNADHKVPECPTGWGYHNAETPIGDGAYGLRPWKHGRGLVWTALDFSTEPHDYAADQRWPTACACGYTFTDDDERQIFTEALYVGSPDGVARGQRDLAVGAVFRSDWWGDHWDPPAYSGAANPTNATFRRGPDGMILTVVVPRNPDGTGTTDWCVDQHSNSGAFWERNTIATDLKPGDFVPLHCNPSIFVFAPIGFHGWLHNGEITSC
jgi:hypothetical protein